MLMQGWTALSLFATLTPGFDDGHDGDCHFPVLRFIVICHLQKDFRMRHQGDDYISEKTHQSKDPGSRE